MVFVGMLTDRRLPRPAFIGFYWTFGDTRQAPLGRFPQHNLQAEIATSFSLSRQQWEARRAAHQAGGALVEEFIYEERGHRPTDRIVGPLNRALAAAEKLDASIMYMDFRTQSPWRPHKHLTLALSSFERSGRTHPIYPDQDLIDYFALHALWMQRKSHSAAGSTQGKDERRHIFTSLLMSQLVLIPNAVEMPLKELARRLNRRGFRTYYGLWWNDDRLRKALPR